MATRSHIGIKNQDNSVTYIYCHWDGYPRHNGKILLNHYQTEDKVRELMKLGDLSTLKEKLYCEGSVRTGDDDDHVCYAYGRDLREKNVECKTVNGVNEYIQTGDGVDYLYLFDTETNKWSFESYSGTFVELTPDDCK